MKTILFVDDYALFREPLAASLRMNGSHVTCANNGEEALQRMNNIRPDLILLDLEMPVMDGMTFFKTISQNPAYANIPVIVLSASAKAMSPDEPTPAAYLVKAQFSLKELLLIVRHYLGEGETR